MGAVDEQRSGRRAVITDAGRLDAARLAASDLVPEPDTNLELAAERLTELETDPRVSRPTAVEPDALERASPVGDVNTIGRPLVGNMDLDAARFARIGIPTANEEPTDSRTHTTSENPSCTRYT